MSEAFLWGAVAASSLILGGLVALRWQIPDRVVGLVMAFGGGVLISAVSFELVDEGLNATASDVVVGFGLLVGSIVYFVGDKVLERMQGEKLRGRSIRLAHAPAAAEGSALALVLGIVLDGIPESFVLGLTVLQDAKVSIAFLAAVFLSNIPEAVGATAGLLHNGWSRGHIVGLWLVVTLVCAISALGGYVLLDNASGEVVAFVMAFAGGAILTMLADAMMPEAFKLGGAYAGPVTTFGFAVAVFLSGLQ